MQYQSDGTQVNVRPAPAVVTGTPGWVTGGNPGDGTPASDDDPDVMNMLLDELVAIVLAAGIALDKTNNAQVIAAIMVLIGTSAPAMVGGMRNGQMAVPAASASATFSADQVVIGTALNGRRYVLPSFSEGINLGTVGAGGMDTGAAPSSGYVAIYAIYNPTTGAAALLGVNATASVVGQVYGGGHMPAGYTASALVSVWRTNSSAGLVIGHQNDRQIWFERTACIATTSQAGTLIGFSVTGAVPPNAKTCSGDFSIQNSTAVSQCEIAADANGIGSVASAGGTNNTSQGQFDLPLVVANTLFYVAVWTGSATFECFVSGYTI